MQNTERQLFAAKWPTVQRAVSYLCSRRVGLSAADRDDVEGCAGLILWRTILRGVSPINCMWVARGALSSSAIQAKRHALASLDDRYDSVQAAQASVVVDGVELTLADAGIDHPELVALWRDGISVAEVARRLGISRQTVFHQADRLGGHAFAQPGSLRVVWKFPETIGSERTSIDTRGTIGTVPHQQHGGLTNGDSTTGRFRVG